jgi:hypothetical protein
MQGEWPTITVCRAFKAVLQELVLWPIQFVFWHGFLSHTFPSNSSTRVLEPVFCIRKYIKVVALGFHGAGALRNSWAKGSPPALASIDMRAASKVPHILMNI